MTPAHELIETAVDIYDDRDQAIALLITVLTLIDHEDSTPAAKWETLLAKFFEITGRAPSWEAMFDTLRDEFGGDA